MHPNYPRSVYITLLLAVSSLPAVSPRHIERDGFMEIEAEAFCSQTLDEVRKWYVIRPDTVLESLQGSEENHAESASGKAYIAVLPDTRVTHDDKLIHGENFSNTPGQIAVLSYTVQFNSPGRYWVWASAYSTGTEDNGLHVGLNGEWPESGQRMQWCDGKHQWTWSSAQRVAYNHCGYPKTIYLDIPGPGVHTIQLSMREDGVKVDRLILTNDRQFAPDGFHPRDPELPFQGRVMNNGNIRLGFETFAIEGQIPFYKDYDRSAFAINAANKENRKGYAVAQTVFDGKSGSYLLGLTTLGEIDGESTYRIKVNDRLVTSFQNPPVESDYTPIMHRTDAVSLKPGDRITVEAAAHTNGKIPENDETAWARGRWQQLIAFPAENRK